MQQMQNVMALEVVVKLCSFILVFLNYGFAHEVETYDVMMPNIRPSMDEQYVCSPVRIAPRTTFNIVGFVPNATMDTVHHMLLYGCTTPGSYKEAWNCGEMSQNDVDGGLISAPVCETGSQIIYAWARDAPTLELPEDVGFLVGSGSDIKYLVLQIHYMHKFQAGQRDHSGLFLKYTREPLKRQAGVYVLGTAGMIQPHSVEHMETACRINEDKVLHPFAYRTHTHTLGKVVAGYAVKPNEYGMEWINLGKRDPLTPQMFYPTFSQVPIRMGDLVAARCTMQSDRDRITYIGSTNKDEMCNFYLMYWVEGTSTLTEKFCYTEGPPNYYWNKAGFKDIPDREASTL